MSDSVLGGLNFDVDAVGDRAVVAVRGALDARSALLLAGVLDALTDAGCRRLVVVGGGVTAIDAAALDVLARVSQRLSETGGSFRLRSPSEPIQKALEAGRGFEFVVDAGASEPSEPQPTDVRDDAAGVGDGSREPDVVAGGADVRPRSSTATVDAALRLVTALAETTVENADGVSVTLERHGRVMTVAASDDAVKEMDAHQYQTGEGPCLAAKAEGRWFYIESLADETRWPNFVPLALEQGIHSILSSPLMTKERPQGALNIYSSTERAFGTRQQELAALFAEQASEILTTAEPDQTDEEVNRRLASALAARQVIHRAQGVIMEREGLTAEAAVSALHRAARAEGRTVADRATEVVDSVRRVEGQP
jgi:anti-anti-sigma factor